MPKKKKSKASVLGSGGVRKAADAMINRHTRLQMLEDRALGVKPKAPKKATKKKK